MHRTANTFTPSSTTFAGQRLQCMANDLRHAVYDGPARADMREHNIAAARAAWDYVVELDARPGFGNRCPLELTAWYDCKRYAVQVLDMYRA